MGFRFRGLFPSDEVGQVVLERTIGAEGILVEKALGAAAQTNLVGISLYANRPTRLAVPAASERHHGRPRQAGGRHSAPPPVGILEFFGFFPLGCVSHHISGTASYCLR